MKKWILIGGLVLLAVLVYRFFARSYNNMVTRDEAVTAQWGNVESQYQRRLDLIPNLVNTVKGYADFEKSTLTEVIEARAAATQVKVDPSNITPEALQQFQAAQSQLSGALSRLLVVIERYPDLKANQNFLELQAQLEGTENRIAVERQKFNDLARDFNTYVRRFPQNLLAGMYGFTAKTYFESDQGAEKAPAVQF
jgi:LemA protein